MKFKLQFISLEQLHSSLQG